MKIGVFDSGIGGLTVLKKLIDKYPNNEYVYFGDTKNIPYGNKTVDELKLLASNTIDFLICHNVELIIIACGTVSSNISEYLKQKYNIKIIDIISPTIGYINNSDYNKICVLATEATINSKVFSNKLNKKVIEIACSNFVPLIESNRLNELSNSFNIYLNSITDVDLIVLGCTHYPIIKDRLSSYFNNNIPLLDMADLIIDIPNNGKSRVDLYFSKLDNNIINNIKFILNDKFDSINIK